MKIYSVYDPAFKAYGQIVTGMDETVQEILTALATTPCTDHVEYVPTDPVLQELPAAIEVSEHCFGGMPTQLGWCNGHNTKLNCLEYHRDSEFNLGTEDFILLLARQEEIEDGLLDTAKVKAFKVPAGVMVEVFATTLHYAPCSAKKGQGFRVLIGLPANTNTDYRPEGGANVMDKMLWARNKWLIAHPETSEAAQGAWAGLTGENIDISADI